MDLCSSRLRRLGGALLPEEPDQTARAQARHDFRCCEVMRQGTLPRRAGARRRFDVSGLTGLSSSKVARSFFGASLSQRRRTIASTLAASAADNRIRTDGTL